MRFQIEQKFGKDGGSYSYFTSNGDETSEQLKELAVEIIVKEWEERIKKTYILHIPKPSFPTITIREYDNANHCIVPNGIKFKTKWR